MYIDSGFHDLLQPPLCLRRVSQVFIQKEDSISFVGDFEGVEVRHKVRLFEAADASLSPMQSLVESNEELKGLDQALAGVADASA